MSALYPLRFRTIYKDKIWGGDKINTILGKDFRPLPNCGETWEISGVKDNVSLVKGGHLHGKPLTEVIEEYKSELLGKKVYEKYRNEFPLLVKFIDANEDLSIQVHPNDELAQERHNCSGKTEMWYILQADEGSKLIAGFNKNLDKEEYLNHLNSGTLKNILNEVPVKKDDAFFIPAGRVHTIGKGLLLTEIQQTSDITYRIYDFDRTDNSGNKRELHTEQALDAIDYTFHPEVKTTYESKNNDAVELVKCDYFVTNKLQYSQNTSRNYENLDSFVIYVCVDGSFELHYDKSSIMVQKGVSILIPASIKKVDLKTQNGFKLLESYIDLK
jgi:mannose-6-phosphate isomerase